MKNGIKAWRTHKNYRIEKEKDKKYEKQIKLIKKNGNHTNRLINKERDG